MPTPIRRKPKVLRPMPPADIGRFTDGSHWPVGFIPGREVLQWLTDTVIAETGALHNPDHRHLDGADLEVLWAASGFNKAGRYVAGQTELVSFRSGGWQKRRQEQQMYDWFGRVPEFLITLDAEFCASCSDAQFCALVEHELYHIAHATDQYGAPMFFKDSGKPKLCIRGHDVEEFVGVVRRYGVMDNSTAALVAAANAVPEVSVAAITNVCGTCLKAAA